MKTYRHLALVAAVGLGAVAASNACFAQTRPAQSAPSEAAARNAAALATLSRPTGRFGRTLGLPKDGKDLYIPDEEYIRFPLPPGAEAYADVDALKIKAVMGEITAISRK